MEDNEELAKKLVRAEQISILPNVKASENEIKFRLVVKRKNEVLLDILGFPRSLQSVTAKDMADAFEAERILEKLIGVRVHILQLPPEGD